MSSAIATTASGGCGGGSALTSELDNVHQRATASSARRASGGTVSTLSLEGSTSSSGSIGRGAVGWRTKLDDSGKQSCGGKAAEQTSLTVDTSTEAPPILNETQEDHELRSVRALLQRVMSTLSQSVTETQLSSFLGSDLKPFAAICSGGVSPGEDDDLSVHSGDVRSRCASSFSGENRHSKLNSARHSLAIDRSPGSMKLSKRESLKVQKRNYRHEKQRATKELLTMLKDPSVVIIADWLKVRGSLKSWTKLWCVLKPGVLVLYKSHKAKSSHWIGTVLLTSCELLERPSKKDGFCFKVFHPLNQSIWATKGPKGENIGAITLPLPYSHLIFRASSEAAGKCWMDALELALRCSSLLIRSMTRGAREMNDASSLSAAAGDENEEMNTSETGYGASPRRSLDDSDCERHFNGIDDDARTDRDDKTETDTDNDDCVFNASVQGEDNTQPPAETVYEENHIEELGQQGEACQTEEVADEHKSLIWSLVKQVRPGMDLSKVVLPTFILEPRSFLDKLSDYYFHVDFLAQTVLEDDPYTRIKQVVRWYLSGFYKKPKGLKKPYNPVLGEVFRCYWRHQHTGSRTFYIAEQISHHPPVSAFYVTNRQDGYVISGSILAKSKFYGNSLSAIMDGAARLVFLTRGEEYIITMPYAHCKGILIGTLTMEFGGHVKVTCEKTGYNAELEFKLKPFLGSEESSNRITGRIKLGSETLATIDGHWDQEVYISYKNTGVRSYARLTQNKDSSLFWNPSPEMKARRLRRSTVSMSAQAEFESEKLWLRVSDAIVAGDIQAATNEKFLLEEEQRKLTRERKVKMKEWEPRLFERNMITGDWVYKYADLRPWDAMNDVVQYEHDMVIQTKTRHQTPIVHTTSIMHIDDAHRHCRGISMHHRSVVSHHMRHDSGSSTPDGTDVRNGPCIESSGDDERHHQTAVDHDTNLACHAALQKLLEPLVRQQQENANTLSALTEQVVRIEHQVRRSFAGTATGWQNISAHDVLIVLVAVCVQVVVLLWLRK